MSRAIKVFFGNDIRRFTVPTSNGRDSQLPFLLKKLREVYGLHDYAFNPDCGVVVLKWQDPDGDLITIRTDEDLEEALKSASSPLRLFLTVPDATPCATPTTEEASSEQSEPPSSDVVLIDCLLGTLAEVEDSHQDAATETDDWTVVDPRTQTMHAIENFDKDNLRPLDYSDSIEDTSDTFVDPQQEFLNSVKNFNKTKLKPTHTKVVDRMELVKQRYRQKQVVSSIKRKQVLDSIKATGKKVLPPVSTLQEEICRGVALKKTTPPKRSVTFSQNLIRSAVLQDIKALRTSIKPNESGVSTPEPLSEESVVTAEERKLLIRLRQMAAEAARRAVQAQTQATAAQRDAHVAAEQASLLAIQRDTLAEKCRAARTRSSSGSA